MFGAATQAGTAAALPARAMQLANTLHGFYKVLIRCACSGNCLVMPRRASCVEGHRHAVPHESASARYHAWSLDVQKSSVVFLNAS
jgi:hypothetical protein